MAASLFSKLRRSYFNNLLFSSLLSNLVIFGQPIQQMLSDYFAAPKKVNFSSSGSSPYNNPGLKSQQSVPETLPGKAAHHITSVLSPLESYDIFYAREKEGVIGKDFAADGENPYDNYFTVILPGTIDPEQYTVELAYDLYGLPDAPQTTKSINNHLAYGGSVIATSDKWVSVSEVIPSGYLNAGVNEIFFNRREAQEYKYKIKNLRFELKKKRTEAVSVAEKILENYKGNVFITGIVANDAIKFITIEGKTIPVTGRVFETMLEGVSSSTKELILNYTAYAEERQVKVPVVYMDKESGFRFTGSVLEDNSALFGNADFVNKTVRYDSLAIGIKKGQFKEESKVRISGLYFKDIRTLNDDVNNVTAGKYQGYKVEKVNLRDSVGIQLHMKFDPAKIPDGYTAKDIKTYYFDQAQRAWKALQVDSLDVKNHEVISTTYGDGADYINGVIKVPDSPETGSFTPTTMSDMKYADPAAGIVSIAPPSPNNTGTAATSFPIKLPQGRNGMQPSLQVTYNSEAGNGWMGTGWNLSTPAITLNTKWGAPLFDGTNETEMYDLNGAELVLKLTDGTYSNPHRQANIARQPVAQTQRQFYERKEGSYNKIVRMGTSPSTYY